MMPPNTPICKVWMPHTEAMVPSRTPGATVPSGRIFPVMVSTALMDTCMTKNAIMAERAATSFSALAMPMATPTANIMGRLSNTTFPALAMMTNRAFNMVLSPRIRSRPYV